MFKVPDWGTDIPDSSVNFGKTSHKKKAKKKTLLVAQESPVKPQVNGNIQKNVTTKKSTEKRRLKKNRQKNREIYQKLSTPQYDEAESSSNHQPGRFVLNPNKVESTANNITDNLGINKNKHDKFKNPKTSKRQKQKPKNLNSTKPLTNTNGTETKKGKKRKHNNDTEVSNIELTNVDTDKADELIIDAKRKKLNEEFRNEDREDVLFGEAIEKPNVRIDRKKEQIKKLLAKNNNRNSINVTGNSNSLRERMLGRLQAAQFRYLNEKLYTSSGTEAKQLFQSDPAAFETYHQGYQQQIKKWPVNPLDVIVKRIMKLPKTHIIADMGCGSGTLAQRVAHKVHSFDLVASTPAVQACDMAHTPLLGDSVDVVVYCLALMGTQLPGYLAEGNRVLKTGGLLLIAEVESRFDSLEDFTRGVERLGFKLLKSDRSHQVFYFMEFRKTQDTPKKARHAPLALKPCLYKRR